MKIKFHHKPGDVIGGEILHDHHFLIALDSEEYSDAVAWLKSMTFNGQVQWFPESLPDLILVTATSLVIRVVITSDRDATLFKLAL